MIPVKIGNKGERRYVRYLTNMENRRPLSVGTPVRVVGDIWASGRDGSVREYLGHRFYAVAPAKGEVAVVRRDWLRI